MEPTIAEVIGWIIILVICIAFGVHGAKYHEPVDRMSDDWIDRNIYGKK